MKLILSVIAALFSLGLYAQKNISIHQNIDDNGGQLSIKVKGTINGNPVDYDRSFDVTGLSKEQRDAIKRKVYDSLGLADPTVPMKPLKLLKPVSPAPVVEANSTNPSKGEYSQLYTVGGDHPYTKEIRYNFKTGLLFMKYRFIKNGEEVTVEKSIDAKDSTKEEREQIIRKYEKEIGVAHPEIV